MASKIEYVPRIFVSRNGFGFAILLSTWDSAAKFTTASKILENLITKTNVNYKLYFYYACCLFELNQIKKSIIYFNKVEELQPDFFLAKLNHG